MRSPMRARALTHDNNFSQRTRTRTSSTVGSQTNAAADSSDNVDSGKKNKIEFRTIHNWVLYPFRAIWSGLLLITKR